MSKELLHVGDQVEANGHAFEVVTVSAQEDGNSNLVNYKYELQLASEVKKLAADERKSAEAEQKAADERTKKKSRLVHAKVVTRDQADNMTDLQIETAIGRLNAEEKEKEAAAKKHKG